VVADGAPGLWKAVSEAWPRALGQRCTVHKLRNLLAKLPERLHREVKASYWAALDDAVSPTQAKTALRALAGEYRRSYPSFASSLEDDLDALVVHLRFPSQHRKRIRSTNLLERTFVEVRRRTKVIGRFPGETSALCLIWAVLELASRGWRGITMTPKAVAEIERLRRALAADQRSHETEATRRWSPRRSGGHASRRSSPQAPAAAGATVVPAPGAANGGGPSSCMPPERSAASRTRAKSTGPAGSASAVAGSLAPR
jgi:putative transposase